MNMTKHKRTACRRLRNLTECPEQAGLRFIDGTPCTLPSLILAQDYLNMHRYVCRLPGIDMWVDIRVGLCIDSLIDMCAGVCADRLRETSGRNLGTDMY